MSNLINAVGMDSVTGQFNIADPEDTFLAPSLSGTSGTPSIALGAAAGSGATFAIAGTNLAGKITLTSGTGILASGTVMTATFANSLSYPIGCSVTFSAGNANFATVLPYLYAETGQTQVVLKVAIALSISSTYIGYYQVVGH